MYSRINMDEEYMSEALAEAEIALSLGEVPIGAVIVYNKTGEIIGRGHNRRNTDKNPLCHAEIDAINEAASFIGDWRIEDCTMYVTIEPCPMCSGAIIQSRIPRVVFGARNPKAGCGGSILNILCDERFNHRAEITEGILEDEAREIMKRFFKRFRKNKED